jgi:hypothetical protein
VRHRDVVWHELPTHIQGIYERERQSQNHNRTEAGHGRIFGIAEKIHEQTSKTDLRVRALVAHSALDLRQRRHGACARGQTQEQKTKRMRKKNRQPARSWRAEWQISATWQAGREPNPHETDRHTAGRSIWQTL